MADGDVVVDGESVPWFTNPKKARSWAIRVAGIELPMTSKIMNLHSSFELDKKHPQGVNLGTITSKGREFATFTIETVIGHSRFGGNAGDIDREADLAQLTLLVRQALQFQKKTGQPYPMDVFAQELAIVGVKSMYVESIDGPEREKQTLKTRFNCIQWAPPIKAPKNVTTTPLASLPTVFTATSGKDPKPPPSEAYKAFAAAGGSSTGGLGTDSDSRFRKAMGLPPAPPTPPSQTKLPGPKK